jgi:hypothetical protein
VRATTKKGPQLPAGPVCAADAPPREIYPITWLLGLAGTELRIGFDADLGFVETHHLFFFGDPDTDGRLRMNQTMPDARR